MKPAVLFPKQTICHICDAFNYSHDEQRLECFPTQQHVCPSDKLFKTPNKSAAK